MAFIVVGFISDSGTLNYNINRLFESAFKNRIIIIDKADINFMSIDQKIGKLTTVLNKLGYDVSYSDTEDNVHFGIPIGKYYNGKHVMDAITAFKKLGYSEKLTIAAIEED